MERLKSDPRTLREVNARFDYEVRNGRAKQAIREVFERNQSRRESAKKEAYRAERDLIEDKMVENLKEMKRHHFNQL